MTLFNLLWIWFLLMVWLFVALTLVVVVNLWVAVLWMLGAAIGLLFWRDWARKKLQAREQEMKAMKEARAKAQSPKPDADA